MISDLGADSGQEVRHEDFVMEMPQSGERIRGLEKMREFQGAYITRPTGHAACRVVVREGCGWQRSSPPTVDSSFNTCQSSS